MAYSDKDWEITIETARRVKTLAELVARQDVPIKEKSTILRRLKRDGVVIGENATDVEKEVKAKQDLAEVVAKNATQNATAQLVHATLVNERLEDNKVFHGGSRYIAKRTLKKLQGKSDEELTISELAQAQGVLQRGQETIYGKQPDTAIQINNSVGAAIPSNVSLDNLLQAEKLIYGDTV